MDKVTNLTIESTTDNGMIVEIMAHIADCMTHFDDIVGCV